ncbi:hypothetical protein H0A58_05970 [Alcaligenaceae bacterium]|nr:hypothetical protein [Alcaligenaceae bacterium]
MSGNSTKSYRSTLKLALASVMLAGLTVPVMVNAETIDFQAMGWASSCVTCHGAAEPIAESPIRNLANVPADEIVQKMKDYAAGDVPGSLMQQIARGYDEATVVRIANWYAQQKGQK